MPPEDEHRSGPWPSGDQTAYLAKLLLDPARRGVGGIFQSNSLPKRAHRLGDIGQPAMSVGKNRNAGAPELLSELGLRVVHDREIRLQREDAFHVWVEQTANARDPIDFGR